MKKKPVKKGRQKITEKALTPKRQRIMEALLNPEHRLKTITEICNICQVTRETYYQAFNNPEFVKIYTAESKKLGVKALAPMVNSQIKSALRGDVQAAKLVMTYIGEYADRQIFPDKKGDPQPINPVSADSMSLMDAAARCAWLLRTALERKRKAEKDSKSKEVAKNDASKTP